MTSARYQHVVPAVVVFGISAIVTWLSFTQEPAESFVFPRVVSVFFIGLAAWNLVRASAGMAKVGSGLSAMELRHIVPGLAVMLVYVFFAAKALGFYVSSTIAFFLIYSIYDPVPLTSGRDWVKRAIVTAVFMAVIYGLFSIVLQVQTPRGLFI